MLELLSLSLVYVCLFLKKKTKKKKKPLNVEVTCVTIMCNAHEIDTYHLFMEKMHFWSLHFGSIPILVPKLISLLM